MSKYNKPNEEDLRSEDPVIEQSRHEEPDSYNYAEILNIEGVVGMNYIDSKTINVMVTDARFKIPDTISGKKIVKTVVGDVNLIKGFTKGKSNGDDKLEKLLDIPGVIDAKYVGDKIVVYATSFLDSVPKEIDGVEIMLLKLAVS